MKTTDTVTRETGISARLIKSVIERLGCDETELSGTFSNVCRGGANAGWVGFTYTKDTVEFFRKNRGDITRLVKSLASDLGEQPMAFVEGFNCLKDDIDDETRESIGRCLYGGFLTDKDDMVANALAWFALEEVARAFEDE